MPSHYMHCGGIGFNPDKFGIETSDWGSVRDRARDRCMKSKSQTLPMHHRGEPRQCST